MYNLAAVLGFPVSHSLSHKIHNFWLRKTGTNGHYISLEVAPSTLPYTLEVLPRLGFAGVNVTIPLKQSVLPLTDSMSDLVRRVGASNMLTFTKAGIRADNTDVYGFTWNIMQQIPKWRPGRAAVLGAGGAARAIIVALQEGGAHSVFVANRTRERADAMASTLGGDINVVDWKDRHEMLQGCDTLVNATSLGMHGNSPLNLVLDDLPEDAVVSDIVYSPLYTPLLASAKARGNRTVDGLGMLLHQAVPAFEAWFGTRPAVDRELRELVLST